MSAFGRGGTPHHVLVIRKIVQKGSLVIMDKLSQGCCCVATSSRKFGVRKCRGRAPEYRGRGLACYVDPVAGWLARALTSFDSTVVQMHAILTQPFWEQKLRIIILTAATFIALC